MTTVDEYMNGLDEYEIRYPKWCPFCDCREPTLRIKIMYEGKVDVDTVINQRIFMECPECGARGPSRTLDGEYTDNKRHAIQRWNWRYQK